MLDDGPARPAVALVAAGHLPREVRRREVHDLEAARVRPQSVVAPDALAPVDAFAIPLEITPLVRAEAAAAPGLPPPFEARDRGQDPGSETEPTSRAVPTPPDEADNTPYNGDSELRKKLRAWLALAWRKVRTEEDRQKIIRVLLEAQGELISLRNQYCQKGEEEKE